MVEIRIKITGPALNQCEIESIPFVDGKTVIEGLLKALLVMHGANTTQTEVRGRASITESWDLQPWATGVDRAVCGLCGTKEKAKLITPMGFSGYLASNGYGNKAINLCMECNKKLEDKMQEMAEQRQGSVRSEEAIDELRKSQAG